MDFQHLTPQDWQKLIAVTYIFIALMIFLAKVAKSNTPVPHRLVLDSLLWLPVLVFNTIRKLFK